MLGRGIGAGEIDGRKRIVDRAVQAEGAAGHGDALGFHLRLVADRLVGSDGVEDAGLRACQAQLLDGRIVEAQRVLRACAGLRRPAGRPAPPRAPPDARRPRR